MNIIEGILNLLRGLVRPLVTIAIIVVILMMVWRLTGEYSSEQLALTVVGFVLGAGATVLGFWFNDRTKPKPPEPPQ